MKNVSPYCLVKCILMPYDEVEELAEEIFGEGAMLEYDLDDGIFVTFDDEGSLCQDDMCARASLYFGVNVTSIHADDATPIGIWFCYKEEE